MNSFETFVQQLHEVLIHLYDPTYPVPDLVKIVLSDQPASGDEPSLAALRRAVSELKPPPETPLDARAWRVYNILAYRYLQGLTQVETAERLGITPRHLRREQQPAVESLARHLWVKRDTGPHPAAFEAPPADPPQATWQSQMKQELASLKQSAPGVITDIPQELERALTLGRVLSANHDVQLDILPSQNGLSTSLQPTALRQILLTAVEKLVQHMSGGQITWQAEKAEQAVLLTVVGYPVRDAASIDSDFIREMVMMQGGTTRIRRAEDRVSFEMSLPPANKLTVLVIDDNTDLVHFYRRYTANTRYEITHLTEGSDLFAALKTSKPDLIVLDVMLPQIDGWELLTNLHEHPETRAIPVVVCSVVRRAELAAALGATVYLPKPVRRQAFLQALDQALDQRSTTPSRNQAPGQESG